MTLCSMCMCIGKRETVKNNKWLFYWVFVSKLIKRLSWDWTFSNLNFLNLWTDLFALIVRWNGESDFLTACYWVCDCNDDEIRSFSEIIRCRNREPGPIFADIEGFSPKAQQNCFSNKPQLPLKVFHKS